ncbi:hypothetical protein BBJ29_003348 [Phytophthora kernoviae]|uniref:TRAF-type domain-containing protein n=1 Tax=Phytophthora kernoviae TaxID=325452 RepID=A0A3F2RWF2_9STRA|nr:hypothetical protein BBJ29_003348 [Phytophthora kernoviae]RLN65553.1 hypothetical protein BBP00_00002763 [Phytophthora kernoviae]
MITPPSATMPSSTLSPAGKVECKFCDDEIEASKIETHEENCDWRPKRCQHCNMVVISRDLMPQSALTTHASRCSKRPIKCIRCCQLFSADAIVAHSTNCGLRADTLIDNHDEEDEDEDYEDDEDDDQLTLAQGVHRFSLWVLFS